MGLCFKKLPNYYLAFQFPHDIKFCSVPLAQLLRFFRPGDMPPWHQPTTTGWLQPLMTASDESNLYTAVIKTRRRGDLSLKCNRGDLRIHGLAARSLRDQVRKGGNTLRSEPE
jgi:hypothetical protein